MQVSYHSAITKIQKLQNLKKKKKKNFFLYRQFYLKLAGTADIFSSTKQEGYMYRFACQYGTESTPLLYILKFLFSILILDLFL